MRQKARLFWLLTPVFRQSAAGEEDRDGLMVLTRRALLEQIAQISGLGATYMAMEALGLALPTPAGSERFALPPRSGNGRSVVILGAGIAGLVCAYELGQAGYDVTIVEARDRIGGRSWTIRSGDRIVQNGRHDQIASFASSLYFNAGPARIPSTHRVILGYARRFGVAVEPFVNSNPNAGWDFGGKVYPQRRRVEDMRGHLAELLAKAIDRHALDGQVAGDELSVLRQFLVPYGSLDDNGSYRPSGASGYAIDAGGYATAPRALPALGFAELSPRVIGLPYWFEHIPDMKATMLQPVGGMDRIAHAIFREAKAKIKLGAQVTAIRRSGEDVQIEHGPGRQMTKADFCICTLPLPVLGRVSSDFSAAKRNAIASAPTYLHGVKVAFEAPRFWEEDDDIFGGLAWTDRLNENVIYPANGFGSARGVLVAAYCSGWTRPENPDAFSRLSHDDRFRICRESIEALHPGKSHLLTKGVTVGWGLTPFSEGVNAQWEIATDGLPARPASYFELLRPEGPIVFAGEHLSFHGAWQEGAALSAHEAIRLVALMTREALS